MKKFLLFAAGLAMTASAWAADDEVWAVVGAYTTPDWNFEASTVLVGTGDELSCTIEKLTSDFKIVEISSGWDNQYGTATPLQIGVPVVLDGKNGGNDPANIKFGDMIQAVNYALVKFNKVTHELVVEAEPEDVERGFPVLYATGSFCEWATPGTEGTVEATQSGGVYTVTFDLGTSGDVEFKLVGTGWSNQVGGGATITADEASPVLMSEANLKTTLTGTQTLTFNMNTMMMTFGDPSLTDNKTEIVAKWAVVGAYSGWDFNKSTVFTGEGNNLSCTIDYLTNDFKIVEISRGSWDTQYGTATPIEINTEYVLDGKNGGADPSNMSFAGLIQAVNNATVKWNPATATFEIVANESDLVIAYPELYLTGSFCDWNAPGEGASVLGVEKDGIYTFTVNLGDAEKTEFKVAGPGWSNEMAGGVEITATEGVKVTKGGNNLFTTLTGEQTLTFNYEDMVMTFGDPSFATGVEGIEADEDAPAVYFNLQGIRVANPEHGIFIVKKAGKTSKVVF